MEFTKSLIKGKLIKRYKRFFVDVKINKEIVTAHCPNTGSMKGLLDEGNDFYVLKNNDPKRKLKYGLEIIKAQKNCRSIFFIVLEDNQTDVISCHEDWRLSFRHCSGVSRSSFASGQEKNSREMAC